MKKLLTSIFSLVFCLIMFAGCNLIELNNKKYYQQTVAQVVYSDKSEKAFTMEDLLQAYNNYGSQMLQNNQELTVEDALKQTAELMVQRYLLIEEIKSEIGELSTEEKNVLKRETYSHINTTLSSYEDEIRVEWERDVKTEEETKEEEKTSLRAEFTKYEPTVEKEVYEETVDGVTKIKTRLVKVKGETEKQDATDPGEFKQLITDEDISAEAWKRYIKNLQENNEDLGKSYTDEEAFEAEINRIYSILEQNKYISKYQEHLTDGLEINAKQVVDVYKEKVRRDYELYSGNEAAYHTAMANDATSVYYHPNSGNEYVYVTHILFKFSDEQTKEIEQLKNLYKSNSITKAVYEERLEELQDIDNLVVTYEENGVTKTTNARLAYQDILNNVNKYDKDYQFELRTKEFNKFIYKYNDDEGIMNKDFAYVVNLDTEVTDQMVKPFADEARRLQKEEGAGGISEPILTDYGYHIILNLGPVKNIVEYENLDSLTWETLYNVKTQPAIDKTIFHVEYDALQIDYNSVVSTILNSKIADITARVEVIKYWEERYLTLLKEKN